MDWKRSALECQRVKICRQVLLGFLLICTIHTSSAVTDPTDGKDSYSFGILSFGILRGLLVNDCRFCGHTGVVDRR